MKKWRFTIFLAILTVVIVAGEFALAPHLGHGCSHLNAHSSPGCRAN